MNRRTIFLLLLILSNLLLPAQTLQESYNELVQKFLKGNYKEVIQSGEPILAKLDKNKKRQQEAYASFAYFIGSSYLRRNQFMNAEPLLRDAVVLLRKMENNPDVFGNACNDLGDLYNRIGRSTEAES